MSRPSATWSPDARSSATCAGVDLPYRASLTGQGLVRVSDASGWRHRPPVGGSTPLDDAGGDPAAVAQIDRVGGCHRSRAGAFHPPVRRRDPLRGRRLPSLPPWLPCRRWATRTAPITRPAAINRNASAAGPGLPIPRSQTGCQRRQASGHITRQPAMVCAANWPIRPHPATCTHTADASEKRKVGCTVTLVLYLKLLGAFTLFLFSFSFFIFPLGLIAPLTGLLSVVPVPAVIPVPTPVPVPAVMPVPVPAVMPVPVPALMPVLAPMPVLVPAPVPLPVPAVMPVLVPALVLVPAVVPVPVLVPALVLVPEVMTVLVPVSVSALVLVRRSAEFRIKQEGETANDKSVCPLNNVNCHLTGQSYFRRCEVLAADEAWAQFDLIPRPEAEWARSGAIPGDLPAARLQKRWQLGLDFDARRSWEGVLRPEPPVLERLDEVVTSATPRHRDHRALGEVVVEWNQSPDRRWPAGAGEERGGVIVGQVARCAHTHQQAFVARDLWGPFQWADYDLTARSDAPGECDCSGRHGCPVVGPDQANRRSAVVTTDDNARRRLGAAVADAHICIVQFSDDWRLVGRSSVGSVAVPDLGGMPEPLRIGVLTSPS